MHDILAFIAQLKLLYSTQVSYIGQTTRDKVPDAI